MVEESRDVFAKRLLGEKHINGIMCENPGSRPSPAADAHGSIVCMCSAEIIINL